MPSTDSPGGPPIVRSVHLSGEHTFSKATAESIELVAGLGVAGDAHQGARVRHRSRVRADPTSPNLRQVHLVAGELVDELVGRGYDVGPGQLGENVTTGGVDLLALPTGAVLALGVEALVSITGLRNPCGQIDGFRSGLLGELRRPGPDGDVVRRAGVMAVVIRGGVVRAGDRVGIALPPTPHHHLVRV